MGKLIIGAVVTGLILFIWQFLSWAALDLHGSNMAYTPNQDKIIECLNTNLSEEGQYFINRALPGASAEEQEAYGQKMIGKPWALVTYNKTFDNNMGMNMARGLIVNIFSGFLLVWFLLKIPNITFGTTMIGCLIIGAISYLSTSYINSIWFETNSIPDLIDGLVPWGIIGAWLGFWLSRK